MRIINGQLTEELTTHVKNAGVAKADAFPVKSYRHLMEHVARLAYANKDHLLFFRGQDRDYRNKAGASTIYPSIYRGDRLFQEQLELRFDVLSSAGKRLSNALAVDKITGYQEVRRRRYIQWSILQHYEVCPTPLLDLTHSLRVACSFAFLASSEGDPYVFLFGLPYITNRVAINSEHDLAIVRLLSICPPEALRPYFQDGYLAGTDEVTTDYESKDELDFNRILIAKFRLRRGKSFWSSGFSALPKTALYPQKDRFEDICKKLHTELGTEVEPGRLGQFLQAWTNIESAVLSAARLQREKVFSLGEALSILREDQQFPKELFVAVDTLRRLRNRVVHQPSNVSRDELSAGRAAIAEIERKLAGRGI